MWSVPVVEGAWRPRATDSSSYLPSSLEAFHSTPRCARCGERDFAPVRRHADEIEAERMAGNLRHAFEWAELGLALWRAVLHQREPGRDAMTQVMREIRRAPGQA